MFTDKPLSSFVIIAWVMSLMELFYCYNALAAPETSSCTFPEGQGAAVGITNWLYVQMAFAVINMVFAPWFQNQVWNEIMKNVDCHVLPAPSHMVPKEVVAGAFKHVLLYDFGVLFYFFALVASFVWSKMGGGWIMDGKSCDATGDPGWAYYMGLCFFWVATLFAFCYTCCGCCAGSVQLSSPSHAYGPVQTGGP